MNLRGYPGFKCTPLYAHCAAIFFPLWIMEQSLQPT